MIDFLKKLRSCILRKSDIKRCQVSRFQSFILEAKAEADDIIGCKSRVGLRVPAGYDIWRFPWMVNEKGKFRYPRRKQREHRPVRIYNLHPDPYKSPYLLVHQKGKAKTSFHFPFLEADNVIAEFVIYTTELLAQEKSQILRNIMEKHRDELSEVVLATHRLRT